MRRTDCRTRILRRGLKGRNQKKECRFGRGSVPKAVITGNRFKYYKFLSKIKRRVCPWIVFRVTNFYSRVLDFVRDLNRFKRIKGTHARTKHRHICANPDKPLVYRKHGVFTICNFFFFF